MDILGLIQINDWLLLFIVLLTTLYFYLTWNFKYFESRGIPGPKPIPLFGTSLPFFTKGIHATDPALTKKYGKVFGEFLGRSPNLAVTDPEMLKTIFVKDHPDFMNHRSSSMNNGPYSSNMLSVARGEHWKVLRSTMSPAFSTGKLKLMTKQINECAQDLMNNMAQEADTGKSFEVKEYAGAFTMDAIAYTAFGLKLDSQNDKNNQFVTMAKKIFNISVFRNPLIFIAIFFPIMNPVLKYFKYDVWPNDVCNFFAKVTDQAMDARKESGEARSDFLQLMINAHKENDNEKLEEDEKEFEKVHGRVTKRGLSKDEIIAQSILFFIAGYDTTASSISFLIYNLAVNPDIQEKLYEEIMEVAGDKEIDYNLLCDMELLEMCVQESMRMFPPALRTDRECNRDTVINGIEIPKGMVVSVPIYGIHHNPEVWPEPEKFNPYRFTPEEKAKHGSYDWMPFGAGPRSCIAMRLALTEFKIAIVYLVRKFKFVRTDKTEVPIKLKKSGFTTAENGIWVGIEKR